MEYPRSLQWHILKPGLGLELGLISYLEALLIIFVENLLETWQQWLKQMLGEKNAEPAQASNKPTCFFTYISAQTSLQASRTRKS